MTFNNQFGVIGEGFTGQNTGTYFGGVLNNNTIDGVNTKGGFAALWIKPANGVKLAFGGGMDDPKDEDLVNGNRAKNQTIFGNISLDIVPQVTVGLEVSQWETQYIGDEDPSQSLRAQTSFKLNF